MFEARTSRASIDPLLPQSLSGNNLLSTTSPTITSYRASGYLQPVTVTNQVYSTSPVLGRASISPKVESTTAYVDQVIAKSRASRIEAERQRQSGIGLDFLQPQGGLGRVSQFGGSSGNVITSYVETESRFETSKNLGPSILDKPLTQTNYYTSSTGLGGGLYNDKSLNYGVGGTYSTYDNIGLTSNTTATVTTTSALAAGLSESKKHKKDLQGIILLMAVEIERLKQNADSANYRVIELEQKYSSSQLREGQVADLNMRLREYESKISILEKENDSWKGRFFSLESESRRLPNLEQELDSLRIRYNNKERELDEVRLRSENAKRSGLDREVKDLTTKFLQEREYLESELRRKDAEIQDLRLRNNMKGSSDQELISLRELLRTREREIEKLRSQGGGSSSGSEEKVAQLSMEIERLRNMNNQKNEDYEILNKRSKAQTDELTKLKAEHSRLQMNFNKLRKNNGGWCC